MHALCWQKSPRVLLSPLVSAVLPLGSVCLVGASVCWRSEGEGGSLGGVRKPSPLNTNARKSLLRLEMVDLHRHDTPYAFFSEFLQKKKAFWKCGQRKQAALLVARLKPPELRVPRGRWLAVTVAALTLKRCSVASTQASGTWDTTATITPASAVRAAPAGTRRTSCGCLIPADTPGLSLRLRLLLRHPLQP